MGVDTVGWSRPRKEYGARGERVNAELKNWRILRKIRSGPNIAGKLIAAVQTLMIVFLCFGVGKAQ